METASGDQPDDGDDSLTWKLVIPRERILFVDAAGSEEFALLVAALEAAKIVAMDAEWKPVRRAGALPRVSILQLSCRLRGGSISWAAMEQILLARKSKLMMELEGRLKDLTLGRSDEDSEDCKHNRNHADSFQEERGRDAELEPAKSGDVSGTKQEGGDSRRGVGEMRSAAAAASTSETRKRNSLKHLETHHRLNIGKKAVDRQASSEGRPPHDGREAVSKDEDDEDEEDELDPETDVHFDNESKSVDKTDGAPGISTQDNGPDGVTDAECEGAEGEEEVIFVLDLLALAAADFAAAVKTMLCSPRILKLGFAFKQDQLNLAASFPGPDANGCFDKIEPYVDIAKLYKQLLQVTSENAKHRGKRFVVGGTYSLTGISKAVLGVPLCKDSQCSNWEQRPLSQEQIEYAASDTHCLLALYDALLPDALAAAGPPPAPAFTIPGGKPSPLFGHRASSLHEMRGTGLKLITDETRGRPSTSRVFAHKTGAAAEMVEAALHPPPPPHPQAGTASRDSSHFVRRYAERLLVGDEARAKARARRPRGRRAREALKNPDVRDEFLNWVGPAPWDVRVGGDGRPKFLCDVMVEGLARQLRCIGVDAACPSTKKSDPRQLVEQAAREGRVLLTKDMKLLRRRLLPETLAYFVKTKGKWEQLEEVMSVFAVSVSESELLSRCVKCNGEFAAAPLTAKEAMAAAPWEQEIPAAVFASCDEFRQCTACRHMFWQLQLHYFFRERLHSIIHRADGQERAPISAL